MLNERELSKAELEKREEFIKDLKGNKRGFVKRYGKDAEKVMYAIATKRAKKQNEEMNKDKIREMIKSSLQGPVSEKKGKDMDGDGDVDSQDYLAARDAAIKKAKTEKVDEMDINNPVLMKMRAAKDKLSKMRAANVGDDNNDKFFDAAKLRALKKKRAEIMRDMEQEAEIEGGPIADKYGDMLNKIDKAIAMLSPQKKGDEYMSKDEIERRAAMIGLEEGFYGPGGVESITNALGYSDPYEFFEDNPGAVDALLDWAENVPEFNEMLQDADLLQEDLDLGHQDNEPHMLKADLYRIGKYAMELYQMVDEFEYQGEVDFPHWWQSKVVKAKDMMVSAKHYLDFEVNEPQIDAMADVAQDAEAIDEAVGKFVVRPCSAKDTPFAVWQTSKDGENDKRIKGFKTKEDAKKFADEKNSLDENSFFQKRLAKLAADEKVKRDKSPGYAAASKLDVDIEDFIEKGQSYGEFKKRLDKLKEGVWSLGTVEQIKSAIQSLEMLRGMDAASIADSLEDDHKFYYNVLGDDDFQDELDNASRRAAMGQEDGATISLLNAIDRAEDLLKMQMEKEGKLTEEAPGKADMVASAIQKAMNKHKGDESKTYQLQQARKAMNKGDLDKAEKIAKRLAEKLKSK